MFGLFKKKDTLPGNDLILPIIRNVSFKNSVQQADSPEGKKPVIEIFTGDLVITYVFDLPDVMQYVSSIDMARLKIDLAAIRELSLENLQERLPFTASLEMEGDYFELRAEYAPVTSMLLASPYWSRKEKDLGGMVAATVPTRDTLLYCKAQSLEGLNHMKMKADKLISQDPIRELSRNFFLWNGATWKLAKLKFDT